MDMANEIHRNVALLRAAGRHDTQTFRELQLAFKSALSVARSLCQSAALAVPRVWSAPALLEMLVTDTGASPEASHDGERRRASCRPLHSLALIVAELETVRRPRPAPPHALPAVDRL